MEYLKIGESKRIIGGYYTITLIEINIFLLFKVERFAIAWGDNILGIFTTHKEALKFAIDHKGLRA